MHVLYLKPAVEQQLAHIRDTDPKSYRRERAAALLKVAAGIPAARVAREGLLRKRKSDTLYRWLGAFEHQGIDGLTIRPGRGRKPAFSPRVCHGGSSKDPVTPSAASGSGATGAGTRPLEPGGNLGDV